MQRQAQVAGGVEADGAAGEAAPPGSERPAADAADLPHPPASPRAAEPRSRSRSAPPSAGGRRARTWRTGSNRSGGEESAAAHGGGGVGPARAARRRPREAQRPAEVRQLDAPSRVDAEMDRLVAEAGEHPLLPRRQAAPHVGLTHRRVELEQKRDVAPRRAAIRRAAPAVEATSAPGRGRAPGTGGSARPAA